MQSDSSFKTTAESFASTFNNNTQSSSTTVAAGRASSSANPAVVDSSKVTANITTASAPVKLSFTQQKLLLQRQLFLAESGSPQLLQEQQRALHHDKEQTPAKTPARKSESLQPQQRKPAKESLLFSGLDDERMQRKRLKELQKRTDTLLKQFWHAGDDPMMQSVKRITSTQPLIENNQDIVAKDSGVSRLLGRTVASDLTRSSSRSSVKTVQSSKRR